MSLETIVVKQDLSTSVCSNEALVLVTEVGLGLQGNPGMPGEQGAPGDLDVRRTAGVTLSALVVVYELYGVVYPIDCLDGMHIDLIRGVTTSAAQEGAEVRVQALGSIQDSSWNFTPGRLYLGRNGTIVETPPDVGFNVYIGSAVSDTSIVLNIQDPTELE